MLIQITKPGVTDASSILDVGATVDYPENVAKSLITGGYAKAVEKGGKPATAKDDSDAEKGTKKATKA